MRKAIFPGTFDPFTVGHHALVKRALKLVDELVISIGINHTKNTFFPLEKRMDAIRRLYANEPGVTVAAYRTLTVDFAEEVGARFILRGVRSVNDFEYEKNMADFNRQLTGVETLILFAEPEYAHINSGMIRELLRYGKDIAPFIPEKNNHILKNNE